MRVLHHGKRAVIATDTELEPLISQADLVVDSAIPAVLDVTKLRDRYPSVVVLSITPFGQTGPYACRPATDFGWAGRHQPAGQPGRRRHPRRVDPAARWHADDWRHPRHPQWWEYSSIFLAANTNKRGLTLDLTSPAGVDVATRLIAVADAVVENFTPRVKPNFGLDWPTIRAVNPRAILVRMPAFGLSGPWRDNTGFAQTMEQNREILTEWLGMTDAEIDSLEAEEVIGTRPKGIES